MRATRSLLASSLALVLLLVAGSLRGRAWSDDSNAPPAGNGTAAPEAPKAPVTEAPKGETPKTEEPKGAEKPATPETAKAALERIIQDARKAEQGKASAVVQKESSEFLAEAAKRSAAFVGEEVLPYARIQAMAGQRTAARETVRTAMGESGLTEDQMNDLRTAFVDASVGVVRSKDVKGDAAVATLTEAEKAIEELRGEKTRLARGRLHLQVGATFASIERHDDALRHLAVAGTEAPVMAPDAAKEIVDQLIETAKGPDAYPTARTAGHLIQSLFARAQEQALAEAEEKKDEKLVKGLTRAKERLASAFVPLEIIGNPIPAWTTVHAFKGGASPADYRGKVVLVDFWATWCPWCIKSFPAMRDLLKEYGDKGFAIVGITTSFPRVFDALYELDDDVKAKAPAGWKPKPALELGPDATPPEKAEHAVKEKEVIAKFLENHEIPWDVVMIETAEPTAKYGLGGWPYGVLVDREGRIRRLHGGAILRDDAEALAELRALIEKLLAEPAPAK